MEIQISDEIIQELVDRKVKEMVQPRMLEIDTITIRDLETITRFSSSFLRKNIVNQPEFEPITYRVNGSIRYKYPEVKERYRIVMNRLDLPMRHLQELHA